MCSQENLRNPNAPALPQVRADARTFSYVLGFSALLLFTVGAGLSSRVLRLAACVCRCASRRKHSGLAATADRGVSLFRMECSRRAVEQIALACGEIACDRARLGNMERHWGRR